MITDLPIVGFYNQQRFKQFDPADAANWYMQQSDLGKKKMAMYPVMGRRHVNFLDQNKLVFEAEPRNAFKSVNYWYAVVNDKIIRLDRAFNQVPVGTISTLSGNVFFSYLVCGDPIIAGNTTYACFVDGRNMYVYDEANEVFYTVTDIHLPKNPTFIANFGNRVVVSGRNSSTFVLSAINLGGSVFNASSCFTIAGSQVFAQESGIIRQMGVLQNTLYIFTDFTCGLWSNIPSPFTNNTGTTTTFPWKKNTSYEFDTGISDPNSLDIDFGRMAWLGQNRNGIVQPTITTGSKPISISSKAIDVLLQRFTNVEEVVGFFDIPVYGFLYDYENTVFYRLSTGVFTNSSILDNIDTAASIEYNFDTQTWHRCIESNGERNRIRNHVYFGNRHLVTVEKDPTMYEMSGKFYSNEIDNPLQADKQAVDAYIQEPFRYERVTPIICAGLIEGLKAPGFYAEFDTKYVEIDFVWGEETFIDSVVPFDDAIFVVDETLGTNGEPVFMTLDQDSDTYIISERGNNATLSSATYHSWFKPHIELLFSDDGGMSFVSADVRQIAQIGVYQWRMRWYQLGASRNRVYKLICVSPAPVVILGGVMEVVNVSGGAS